jgi:hypothetical protein
VAGLKRPKDSKSTSSRKEKENSDKIKTVA